MSFMEKLKTEDMTEGSIAPKLLVFAFPIMFSSLFYLVYSLADSFVVGRFVSGNALAAVSVTGNATYLLYSFVGGINMGSSVIMAQACGAKNHVNMKKVLATSIWVLGGLAILFTILGITLGGAILRLIQTPEDIFEMARAYMTIIFAGTLSTVFYDWLAAILRAFGNSFVPLLCLIASGVMNVILDLVFVLCFGMGIEGAAWATVISQASSGVVCFYYAWIHFPVFHLKKNELCPDWNVLKKILLIGIPAAVQDSIITVSNMVLQGVMNTYGTIVVLAYGIVSKYELVCMQVGDALGNAIATFTGQNIGAEKLDRVSRSVKITTLLNFAGYAIVSPLIYIFAERCMGVFTNDSQAIAVGSQFLRVYAVFFPALGILILFQNLLRSAGDIRATICMGICEVCARSAFSLGLPLFLKAAGLPLVSPFTWLTSMLLGLFFYLSGHWKKKRLL